MSHQFLLEILCEEIPANAVAGATLQLVQDLAFGLEMQGLKPDDPAHGGYTARRMMVHFTGLPQRQDNREQVVLGPPARTAFSDDGAPTQAAMGFARAQGVEMGDLQMVEGPKGQVVAAKRQIPGRPTVDVLRELVEAVVPKLRFPKSMRWGSGEYTFVRPVHGIVALFGCNCLDQVVPIELFGVTAGSSTVGQRVIAPAAIELLGISGVDEYEEKLRAAGVLIDPRERRKLLRERATRLANEVSCTVRADAHVEGEHVELVEYPGVLRGAIAARYLALPEEVLVTTLRHHQKCLVLEKDGKVAPYFLAVSDRADDPEGHVVQGNEWVAGARLADAEFFFQQDRKKTLEEHGAALSRVTFHQKLGSYADKTKAVIQLVNRLTELTGDRAIWPMAERAAKLVKADLVTAVVGEFPELQGVIGGIYARLDGEPDEVWWAIYDQYSPVGLDGPLPRGIVGAIVGVADRLDTLAALFAGGEVPTGSKDPFALRRAALGIVMICAGAPLTLPLNKALGFALATPARARLGGAAELKRSLQEFVKDRERYYLTSVIGVAGEVADAVLEARWGVVPEDVARARALEEVRQEPVFADLAVAFKRVRNIVAKAEPGPAHPELLQHEAEKELQATLDKVGDEVPTGSGDWSAALRALATLAGPLDRFFTEVLVMDEDQRLREARIALLRELEALFLRVADLSRLAGEARGTT